MVILYNAKDLWMNNVVQRMCPFCESDNTAHAATIFGNATWPIKKCHTCKFVYLEVAPIYERLVEEFAWEKTSIAEKKRRVEKEPIRQFISSKLKILRQRYLRRNKLDHLIRRFILSGYRLRCRSGAE